MRRVKPCIPACRYDETCTDNGVCVPSNPNKCRTNQDCPKGFICSSGVCIKGTTPNYECWSDSQCISPKKCINNWCTFVGCDCNRNEKCFGNQCFPIDYCRTTADCIHPAQCLGNKCLVPIDPCRACSAFEKCIDSRCYPKDYCRYNADCTSPPYT